MPRLSFDQQMRNYAALLVHCGAAMRPGKMLWLETTPETEVLGRMVGIEAYRAGAKYVHVSPRDSELTRAQLTYGKGDDRFFVPTAERVMVDQIVDSQGSWLALISDPQPQGFAEMEELVNQRFRATAAAHSRLSAGRRKGPALVTWCHTVVPGSSFAQRVFPDMSVRAAQRKYWEAIFKVAGADHTDCVDRWHQHTEDLKDRVVQLNDLRIKSLRFTSAAGTDFTVGLSKKALWAGGKIPTEDGRWFSPNIPTFEVFTTPDWRTVTGKVVITKPFYLLGVPVKDAVVWFKKGRVTKIQASSGAQEFRRFVKADQGAAQIGEIALVGLDSPIAGFDHLFHATLYDENAACHMAFGSGFAFNIKGFSDMSERVREKVGFNTSRKHLDVMISDATTDVWAALYSDPGTEVQLLKGGYWTPRFA